MKRVVGLTGTPAPNGLIDLWPQIYLLDGGERLGKTITGFRERYFYPDKRNQYIVYSYKPKEGAKEAIYKRLSDICVSMKAEDYLKLPEKINNIIPVHLSKKAKGKYDQLERDLLLPLKDADIVANTAGVLTNKLLQMANGAVYDENGQVQEIHKAKLKALEDVLEAANGKPVLIFYAYKHDLTRIKKHLKGQDLRILDKAEDIRDWNNNKVPIMLAHPASAGHGLNLQAGGNIIVWFGLTWSLELYSQANARLYRQGQKQNVIIHHLVAKGTIDEDVMKALENKEAGQEALLNAVKARIKNLYPEVV
jgi:SNF2 family DNA or RNA helicase